MTKWHPLEQLCVLDTRSHGLQARIVLRIHAEAKREGASTGTQVDRACEAPCCRQKLLRRAIDVDGGKLRAGSRRGTALAETVTACGPLTACRSRVRVLRAHNCRRISGRETPVLGGMMYGPNPLSPLAFR